MRPGFWEIVVVAAILILLFGARRLPELARAIGRSLSEFKKGRAEGAEPEQPPRGDATPPAPPDAK